MSKARKIAFLILASLFSVSVKAKTLHFPHYGDGGGLSMIFALSNLSTGSAVGSISFYGPSGAPQTLPFEFGEASRVDLTLAPNASRVLKTTGQSSPLKSGFAVVELSQESVSGVAIFVYPSGREAGVLPATMGQDFGLFVQSSQSFDTGVAVFRPSGSQIQLELYNTLGALQARREWNFEGEHTARFLRELFPLLPREFEGMLRLKSSGLFAPVGLRFGSGVLSTLPLLQGPPPGRLYGVNFSPYIAPDENPERGGDQITLQELESRLASIAPRTKWIRTFGCDGDLREAGRLAHKYGLKIAGGAWLGRSTFENNQQVQCLIEVARDGHLDMAIVGSEVLLRGDLTSERLIQHIDQVRSGLREANVEIPVTTADVQGVLLAHPEVLAAVDVVFANFYPYWEGVPFEASLSELLYDYRVLQMLSGCKDVIVSETGWPSCGNSIGMANPTPGNAASYFLRFADWAGKNDVPYFYFEAFDEPWKTANEGPQGACWGIWNANGQIKPQNRPFFEGALPELAPIPEPALFDFFALPGLVRTNLSSVLVAFSALGCASAELNGRALTASGNEWVSETVPLTVGENRLELLLTDEKGRTSRSAVKTVLRDPNFSTDGPLLYVSAVPDEQQYGPSGTIVLGLQTAVAGFFPGLQIRGIAPDGTEIYMQDGSVFETRKHQFLRRLPFRAEIPRNAFLVSPRGDRLFSRQEVVETTTNIRLENLPRDITTGSSWRGAPIPGGPAISLDGRFIYCCDDVRVIDVAARTERSLGVSGNFLSDLELTPSGGMLLISEYSFAQGRLDIYDSQTGQPLATLSGLGDFTGQMAFSTDGSRLVVGSAGNPQSGNGFLTVIDLPSKTILSQMRLPLADNITVSESGELYAASGDIGGVEVFEVTPEGKLSRKGAFFLGINKFVRSFDTPKKDQIRNIVAKPDMRPSPQR